MSQPSQLPGGRLWTRTCKPHWRSSRCHSRTWSESHQTSDKCLLIRACQRHLHMWKTKFAKSFITLADEWYFGCLGYFTEQFILSKHLVKPEQTTAYEQRPPFCDSIRNSNINDFWATNTCQQRPLFLHLEGGRFTQGVFRLTTCLKNLTISTYTACPLSMVPILRQDRDLSFQLIIYHTKD